MLLSLAATSIIGTVVPQNKTPEEYLAAYGASGHRLMEVLGVLDMYHSWWFQGLLLVLMINIVACSINHFQKIRTLIFNPRPDIQPDRFTGRKDARHLEDSRDTQALLAACEPVIKKRYPGCRVLRTDDRVAIYGEKGRWSRLGVYIVHASVVLLLVGGLVGSMFGFEASVALPEGETTDVVFLQGTRQPHALGFAIRCDSFAISRYDSGRVKEYRSALTILENGKPVLQKDIIVNDPLRYRGINIFQASYGQLAPRRMTPPPVFEPTPDTEYHLNFMSKASGMNYPKTVKAGVSVELPENLGTFIIVSHEPEADFHGRPLGPSLKAIVSPPGAEPVTVLLPFQFPGFDRMRGGDVAVSVVHPPQAAQPAPLPEEPPRYYTGLQVTRDPGVFLVYLSFALMIAGCFVTFYLSHQQVCIVIDDLGEIRRVTVAGTANRNRFSMQQRIEKIFGAISAA